MPGRIAGRVMRQKVTHGVGAEVLRGLLGGAVDAGQARRDQAHHPGDDDHDMARHQRVEGAEHVDVEPVLDLDVEDVHRRAQHDAGHDQRHQQQAGERRRGSLKLEARQAERRRHAEQQADHGRSTPTWRLRRSR